MLHEWQQRFAATLRQGVPASVPIDDAFLGTQVHRFAVYRDNMLGSLVEALGDTFPVTRQLLGDQFFNAVAADFVRSEPPVAARLSRYGVTFPDRLRALPQLRDLAYVPDVAALEWARVATYFCGVSETRLSADVLLSQSSEDLPHLIFIPAPSLQILSLATAAQSIWQAHQKTDQDLSQVDPWQPEAMRLLCQPAGILVDQISVPQAIFLRQLQDGAELMVAAETVLATDATFDLQAALAAELAAGSLSGIVNTTALQS